MANWSTIGITNLDNSRGTVGYVYLQYDSDSTGGTTWPVRLITGARPNYSFNVRFDNVTVDGNNQGTKTGVTQNSVTVWSGACTGGRSISGSWSCPWDSAYGGTRSYAISGSLPSKGQAPTGLTVDLLEFTDTTVRLRGHVDSYGSPSIADGRYVEVAVLGSSSYGSPYRYMKAYNDNDISTTVDNDSITWDPILNIQGNTSYRYGAYADNTSLSTSMIAPATFVTLPSYIIDLNAVNTGGGTMNVAVIHGAEGNAFTVYTEYSWDGENWTTVSDPFNVTITEPKTIYVRRFSDAGETPVFSKLLVPNNGKALYGSVNSHSKSLSPVYATFGNYFDGRHYLERSNASVDISGDQVTITKTSSGSGTWTYIFFLIDSTDELINKEVTLSGEFSTSGSFTSGPRLFWMKSNNVDWLSIVNGMDYQATGSNKKFSITGTIPARPSGAGKLGLGLYANGSTSSPQGSYTVYNNVELKANTKNMFNYIGVKSSVGGLTPSQSADGTITVTGILSSNYQHITSTDRNITNTLEDGVKYTISAANTYTPDLAIEIRAKKTGESAYSYWNTRGQQSSTFTVDKTTYEKYEVYVITSTTASWGTSSKTVSNKFQLEKGGTATSFAPFVDTKTHKLKKIYGSVGGHAKLIYDEGAQ